MNSIQKNLKKLGACSKAIKWASAQKDLRRAWWMCPRGDWLLWLAARLGVERRLIVFAACDCARGALAFTEDPRVRAAVIRAEQWANGDKVEGLDEELLIAAEEVRRSQRALPSLLP